MYEHAEFATDRALAERLAALPTHVVYGQLTSPHWGEAMAQRIPTHMHAGFVQWVAYGNRVRLGRFMQAVLENDLMGAYKRADEWNLPAIPDWVLFLHNAAPLHCFGSPARVKAWPGILVA